MMACCWSADVCHACARRPFLKALRSGARVVGSAHHGVSREVYKDLYDSVMNSE